MAFYAEWPVNYTAKGVNAYDYKVSGGDIEICFQNSTQFFEGFMKEVYVTDYLKMVQHWPLP